MLALESSKRDCEVLRADKDALEKDKAKLSAELAEAKSKLSNLESESATDEHKILDLSRMVEIEFPQQLSDAAATNRRLETELRHVCGTVEAITGGNASVDTVSGEDGGGAEASGGRVGEASAWHARSNVNGNTEGDLLTNQAPPAPTA